MTTDRLTPRLPGYIYIMQCHPGYADWSDKTKGVYKIGLSIHPNQREDELNRNLQPFIRIRQISVFQVQNMFDVEQKLHSLFEDKRIGGEYFELYDHDLDAFYKFVEQVKEVITPTRKRRATSGFTYNINLNVQESPEDIPLPSELESLILSFIPHTRSRLSKKMIAYLNAKVVVNGKTYPSPEDMWKELNTYRKWAERQLEWVSSQPNPKVEMAVHSIRKYDGTYGYISFNDGRYIKDIPKPDKLPEEQEIEMEL